jgi:hypothetical protein
MVKHEALFTTKFKKWLHAYGIKGIHAAAYEIKVTDKKSIPFNAVSTHQLESLLAVSRGKFIYKIPDAGWQNPFDMFVLSGARAYIILAFKVGRKYNVWQVDIHVWMDMREKLGRKSVDEDILQEYHSKLDDWCELIAEI